MGSALGRRIHGPGIVSEILVKMPDAASMERAKLEVEAILRVRHRLRPGEPNTFEIETAEASLDFWNRISTILFIALPLLVGTALVVGALVIMNIMLMSVVERTREIGMRKAVGARRRDIVLQVLVESGTLSGVGAVAGIGIGVVLAQGVSALSPLPASVAPHWILGAALLGIGVGVLAGLYPAARAARLDPIVALRQE
jgi:putative ABC transport system permease protein